MQSPTITLSSGSLAPGFSPIRMTFTRVTQDQNASAPQTRARQHELGRFRVKTQLTGGLTWILRPCHNRFDRSERDLPPILRRKILKGALGLALLPLAGARVSAAEAAEGAKAMTNPDFDLARVLTLNRVPESEQRAVFDKFGPESGRVFFELFFWMFDQTGATTVDPKSVTCPVLCLAGADDNLVSVATARATAESYPGATSLELEGHGHVLVLEPGAEKIARRIAE